MVIAMGLGWGLGLYRELLESSSALQRHPEHSQSPSPQLPPLTWLFQPLGWHPSAPGFLSQGSNQLHP